MKELILIFTLSILGFSTHAQSLDDLSYGTDSTLEVMTWNLEWFPKNGLNTLDSVRKIIEALDVDIIACQEITDTTLFLGVYELFNARTGAKFPHSVCIALTIIRY